LLNLVRGMAPLLVALVAVAVAQAHGTARSASHDRIGSLHGRIATAEEREQAIGREIAAQSERIDGLQSGAAALAAQVRRLRTRLSRERDRLHAIQERLNYERAELRRLRGELRRANERLSRRLVEIYESEQPGLMEIVLGASDLESLVDQIDLHAHLARQNEQIVDEVATARGRLRILERRTARLRHEQALRTAAVAGQTARRAAAYAELVAQRDQVVALVAGRKRLLASIRVQRQRWEGEASALEAATARIATAAAALPASPIAVAPTGGHGFIWPVRGTLVSPFGTRWGKLHAGIDIAAPTGTPIAASAGGTITFAGSMDGYGLVVVIQHANGISTAYAHDSSIAVSVGQAVSQGQTIASVGCTGHCFGSHVHFEVRVNGTAVDPMGYL
jgi:murein DD-endopeptidase MepM/ murein hydrolase activator NlpD